jgi:hypothetical protein
MTPCHCCQAARSSAGAPSSRISASLASMMPLRACAHHHLPEKVEMSANVGAMHSIYIELKTSRKGSA